MKAVIQRRLTPVLVLLCAVLVFVLLALVGGVGRDVRWKPALPIRSVPIHLIHEPGPVTRPLASMQDIWQHILFEPSRKQAAMVVLGQPAVTLEGLTLTGLVRTPSLHVALLQDSSGKPLRIPLDGMYQGWRLLSLESHRVVFARGADRAELVFPKPKGKFAPGTMDRPEGTSSTVIAAAPQSAPMLTTASSREPALESVAAPVDDVAIRRARMDALKKIVMRRRQASPTSTGSP
ncbi:hypothetical protein ISP15_15595 [Dyella jejuensis]|uniref:General secretion pathway protein N n=1 Tax=Dyella jejuensis TaxID=1432009 RepID=A0ABW8JNK8_9GAMM